MAKYKFLILCAILLCTITTFAQPAQYTPMTAAGYQMKRLKVDSTLHLPSFCGVPTLRGSLAKDGALAIDTCGGYLYMWTNQLGWDTINVTVTGGGGNQDLQSVLNNGNSSYNKDINLLGRTSGNQIYISPLDNNWMPFMALGDSIGGGIYQYTYPKATIEFINKYMSQKLIGQDSTRSIIYLPVQTIDATDTLAKLSDVRNANFGGDFWKTSGKTILSGADTISSSNGVLAFVGGEEDMARFWLSALDVEIQSSDDLNFTGLSSVTDTSTYKPLGISNAGVVKPLTSWVSGGSAIDTTNQFVKRLDRTPGKDSIIYFVGANRFAIKDSVGTNPAPVGYYGAWQDNITQSAASSNVGYPLIYRTVDLENQVRVVTNGTNLTRITFDNTGIYNLQFSVQIQNTDNAQHDVTIWLRKNGTDVTGSAGFISVPARKSAGAGNEGHGVYGWNYLLSVVAGEYYEIVWSTTNAANITIQYYAAGSPPPSTASVIATVTQQSGIMAGTGITAINSLTGAAQTITTGTTGTDFAVSSTGTTHTLNLPTASATNRGALSSANWSTFNSKLSASDTVSLSNRINLKLNSADTASLSNRINLKLNSADTASLSNRINLKLNIADTTVFQRKSIPSYTFLANNTTATANAQALYFKDTSGSYTGTITWNGTAPTSGTFTYRWTRIGKMVNLNISLVYANAGTTNSQVVVTLPADAPTPTKPGGLTAASNMLYPALTQINATNQSTLTSSTMRGMMRSNSNNNGFEFLVNCGSTSALNAFITCTYFTD